MAAPSPCLLCGASTAPDSVLAPLGIVRCTACAFTFAPALADTETTRKIYEGGAYEERVYEDRAFDEGNADAASPEERDRNAQARLSFLTEHVPGRGRLLDVGAAGGAFVAAAARAGFTAAGIEPAPAFARHARESLGVDVRDGRVEDVVTGEADVITLWHVLEHVPDPVDALRHLREGLTPGGHLVIEVPNLESVAAGLHGVAWTHLDAGTHVSHFSRETLSAAMRAAGLVPVTELSVPHDVYLTAQERRSRGPLGARVKLGARAARERRTRDPWRHEFLRVVARSA